MRSMNVMNDIGKALFDVSLREDFFNEDAHLDRIINEVPHVDTEEIIEQLQYMRFFIVDLGVKLSLGQNNGEEITPILNSFERHMYSFLNSREQQKYKNTYRTFWASYQKVGPDHFIDEVPYVFEQLCDVKSEEVRLAGSIIFSLFFDFVIQTARVEKIK